MGTVYTIAMHKGGVGKTSLVTNLVGSIKKKYPKKRILIVDTDGQSNVSVAFGKDSSQFTTGVFNLFVDNEPVENCIYEISTGIDLIPATDELDFLEFDILLDPSKRDEPFSKLDNAIEKVKEQYDFIFIDTPPSLNLITGNALKVSDKVIIPFQPETFGVNGIKKILRTINDLNETLDKDIEVLGVIGMMVESRTTLHSELLKQARQFCGKQGIKMFDVVIPKSIRFANATAYEGIPATMQKLKRGKGQELVEAYYELLDEIIEYESQGVTQ